MPEPVTFPAPVLQQEDGQRYHYVPLPADVATAFEREGVRRVVATVNGTPIRRGILNRADGERYLALGIGFLRDVGAAYGDTVVVELAADPEPDRIDLGEELEAVLEQDEEAAARFYGFTLGNQRSLASYVTSAKRPETRVKRALDLAHKLRTYTLYGDLHPEKR